MYKGPVLWDTTVYVMCTYMYMYVPHELFNRIKSTCAENTFSVPSLLECYCLCHMYIISVVSVSVSVHVYVCVWICVCCG